ncbi:transcriptional regulator [Salinadaptatus halalkaliphilus]|uniref:Transcriptional regulator n=1 Tax=Salinadaptatus halalkaliphilus TaxID=2419781 RepID=A0A4S3TPN1_9EURY|nr:transcriptional regulator [Salinadaptatus halalkaliphilus]THE66292.1 transcriptional regulator [Salinadaptatus halalkaliphilus]
MREADETTRQRLAATLREQAGTPSELAARLDVTPHAVVDHVDHVARSLEGTDEQLLVAPPTCRDCGFEDFDDLVNLPSRCPDCKSESVDEPTYTVE